ncbi:MULTISPECIES: hypothetical protein [unclassified Sphingomonas]|nr:MULTISPECIES: hypothetical protein [unclassified Sphingomonas]
MKPPLRDDTAYLFDNASGSADPITGIVAAFDTTATSIDQFDFA